MDQLWHFCERRLTELFSLEARPLVEQRLRQELNTIQANGQADVFVEAQRTVLGLRDQGVSYQLIGAGCSSLVCYLMQLSEIDPVLHGLPYERFLEANTSKFIQFQFVAQLQTDKIRDGLSSIQSSPSNCAVSIRQATFREAIPWFVTKEIRRTYPDFDLTTVPETDQATFETLQPDNMDGIETRRLRSHTKVRCLTDIAVCTSLQMGEVHESGMIREFLHREAKLNRHEPENWIVEQTLQETRGMILFQEQIMLILNRVADIPLAASYAFIKTVCKGQWEQVASFREWFMVQAIGNGMNEPCAHRLFVEIRNAATRAVCKAHYLSEAVTSYRTAFLKAYFPEEFSRTLRINKRRGYDEHHGEEGIQSGQGC